MLYVQVLECIKHCKIFASSVVLVWYRCFIVNIIYCIVLNIDILPIVVLRVLQHHRIHNQDLVRVQAFSTYQY